MLKTADDIVFLFDVDNTLLDNDRVVADLRRHLIDRFGRRSAGRYWSLYETLRAELGYSDYLGALQRYRQEVRDDPDLLQMSLFLLDYPFSDRLYPGAMAAVAHAAAWGKTVVLSDGDVVFQPRKIQRCGLWSAVQGRVLVYIHKEEMLDAVMARFPARHYVMVDDKVRILAAMKQRLGPRLTTVFPRQGHYARDAASLRAYSPADISVAGIGDFTHLDLSGLSRGREAGIHIGSHS